MNFDAPHHCCSPLEGSSHKAFVCRFIFESHCVSYILTYVAFFIYALKNMAITNIPAGNGIILSGNRQLAATFVKISKRRLWEMRQLMIMSRQTMMQRSFYLDRNCVWVRMHIIGNAEFIRIHACSEGEEKCGVSFTSDVTGSNPSIVTVKFTSELTGTANEIFWDFGDGSYLHTTVGDSDTSPSHSYKNDGTYTVIATAINFDESASLTQPDVPFENVFREVKDGPTSNVSHADGYALFQSTAFTSVSGEENSVYRSAFVPGGAGSWSTLAIRKTVTIPLQNIAAYPSVVSGSSLIWIDGLHRTWSETTTISSPAYEILSGSNLALPMRLDFFQGASEITPIDNDISMIETVVRLDDSDSYPILPDPSLLLPMPPAGRLYHGWIVNPNNASSTNIIKVRPYSCMATSTETVTIARE